jgi:hypothetical protein
LERKILRARIGRVNIGRVKRKIRERSARILERKIGRVKDRPMEKIERWKRYRWKKGKRTSVETNNR